MFTDYDSSAITVHTQGSLSESSKKRIGHVASRIVVAGKEKQVSSTLDDRLVELLQDKFGEREAKARIKRYAKEARALDSEGRLKNGSRKSRGPNYSRYVQARCIIDISDPLWVMGINPATATLVSHTYEKPNGRTGRFSTLSALIEVVDQMPGMDGLELHCLHAERECQFDAFEPDESTRSARIRAHILEYIYTPSEEEGIFY